VVQACSSGFVTFSAAEEAAIRRNGDANAPTRTTTAVNLLLVAAGVEEQVGAIAAERENIAEADVAGAVEAEPLDGRGGGVKHAADAGVCREGRAVGAEGDVRSVAVPEDAILGVAYKEGATVVVLCSSEEEGPLALGIAQHAWAADTQV
jgi:hypothetical protein